MLPISSSARGKLFSRSLTDRVEIRITPNYDGASAILFEDKDIVPSSFSISKVCSDGDIPKIGTSMLQQLDIQLRYNFGENDFIGAKVETKYFIKLTSTTEELLATHVFFIDTIEQTTPKITTITGYCIAKLLSKSIGSRVFSGKPFAILNQMNTVLGVPVFDVPTGGSIPTEFADLPNVEETIQLSKAENGCETFRDITNAIGTMIGVFFQTTPSTEKIKPHVYHEEVDLIVGMGNRKSYSHNRYPTLFDGLKVNSTKGTFVSPTTELLDRPYIIEDSPAWDYGSAFGLQTRTDNLMEFISGMEYTPSSLTMWSDPTIECGDRLQITCDDGDYEMLVTEVTWNYNGNTVVKSAGEKAKGTPSSTTGSSRSSSVSSASNKMVMYSVTNNSDVNLTATSDPNRLCRITFSTMGATEVLWFGETLINAVVGTNPYVTVKVTYKLDGAERTYYPKANYVTPENILSMFHSITVEEQSAHVWEVYLEVLQGAITVNQFEFNGTLMGQNLVVSGDDWGGILTLFDDVASFVASAVMHDIQEGDVTVSFYTPITRVLSDDIEGFEAEAELKSLGESVTITLTYEDVIFCHDNGYCGGGMLL